MIKPLADMYRWIESFLNMASGPYYDLVLMLTTCSSSHQRGWWGPCNQSENRNGDNNIDSELYPHRGLVNWTDTELYLFHVQRTNGSGVTDARFTDHRLGKLHLSCDVGHLHWVVVIVGDIESVLDEKQTLGQFIVYF